MKTYDIYKFLECVGSTIKEVRIEQGYKSGEFSKSIEIAPTYFSRIENARNSKVSLFKYLDISNYLELPFSYIIKRAELKLKETDNNYDDFLGEIINKDALFNKNQLASKICREFRNIRKEKGIYRPYMANTMGVTVRYYGDIEIGTYLSTSLYRYKEIAIALDTPLNEIVERAENALINDYKNRDNNK